MLLQQAWQVKRWGVLPEAGGLLDQPAGLLAKMGRLLDVYTANRAYYDALMTLEPRQVVEWEKRNPDAASIVLESVRLRKRLETECNGD